MNIKNKKVSFKNLSDEEALRLIYNEYMRVNPKNYNEFYAKSCLPSLPTLQKRFHMK